MKSKVSNHLFIGLLTVILGVAGATIPSIHAQAASTKSVTVTNEKQLTAALKENKVTKITIKDKNALSFVEGTVAKATKVTVSSNGKKLVVTDNGDLSSLKVNAKTALTVKGNSDRTPVTVSADGTTLAVQKEASVKINADVQKIVVSAEANINVAEGATLGTVHVNEAVKVSIGGATKDMVADGVDTSVANKTAEKIEVTKSDGTTQTVGAGEVVKTENTSDESSIPGDSALEKQDFAVTGVQ